MVIYLFILQIILTIVKISNTYQILFIHTLFQFRSPVHRSEKFWRENAHKLNDANYELLKILINLLETANDPLILSVACFDLGEYVRHYQRGKQ